MKWKVGVPNPAGAKDFSHFQVVQTDPRTHPGYRGSFPVGKGAGV